MTIAPETDWRTARRADRAAEREQDREDARLRAELERDEKLFREERADARRSAEAERRRQEKAQRRKDKAAAAAQRTARWRKRAHTLREHGDVAATLAVMACGMIPALVAQERALVGLGMGMLLGCLLPVMLELGAWAATAGEAKALKEHRRVGPYRTAVWAFAALAAGVNYWHGSKDYGLGGGIVLAASSIAPVALWHMVMAGRHSAKAKRTRAEIAAERKAKAEAKARAKHLKDRRRHHPQVAQLADRLLSAAPYGAMDAEEAWRQAWEATHGATALGMTPELYAAAVTARRRLVAAFEQQPDEDEQIRTGLLESLYGPGRRALPLVGESVPLRRKAETTPQVAAQIPPVEQKSGKRRPQPPRRRKGDTAPYHPAARVAARETALRATPAK